MSLEYYILVPPNGNENNKKIFFVNNKQRRDNGSENKTLELIGRIKNGAIDQSLQLVLEDINGTNKSNENYFIKNVHVLKDKKLSIPPLVGKIEKEEEQQNKKSPLTHIITKTTTTKTSSVLPKNENNTYGIKQYHNDIGNNKGVISSATDKNISLKPPSSLLKSAYSKDNEMSSKYAILTKQSTIIEDVLELPHSNVVKGITKVEPADIPTQNIINFPYFTDDKLIGVYANEAVSECPHIQYMMEQPVEWEYFEKHVKSLDAIFMRGNSIFSKFIRKGQKMLRENCSLFSHAGLVVKKDILGVSSMKENVIYLEEAVVAGIISNYDSVLNTEEQEFNGVQIREFLKQIIADENADTTFYWMPLDDDLRKKIFSQFKKEELEEILFRFIGKKYPIFHPGNFISAMSPSLHYLRGKIGTKKDEEFYCSELVARIYQLMNIIDPNEQTEFVFPADFFIKKSLKHIFKRVIPIKKPLHLLKQI